MKYHRQFTFELPTRITFGVGALAGLPTEVAALGGSSVLLVSDPGLVAAGVVDRVVDLLSDSGLEPAVFTDVEPEPDAKGVMAAAELARTSGADIVVGVGGGSALDTAKSAALMARNPGHIRDFVGLNVSSAPGLPVIAIPTTAGTGSECAIWAVISEKEKSDKYGIGGRNMTATVALCDPALTLTLPARQTVGTGADALAHALESYVNKATQPISEALAEKAVELIAGSLRQATFNGADLDARSNMMIAATMAACAFAPTRLGLAHAMAMPLGAFAKIPHGDVIAILLPEVMRYNVVAAQSKFAEIARLFGIDTRGMTLRQAADAGVTAASDLLIDIGAPSKLSAYGVTEADLPKLAEESMSSGNVVVNPRPARAADLVEIMRKCL
ncbi:iron-containing alcohol dehydrogenase [Microbacterium aurantiacum]|uniref:Iron-containing alcohol dehydrogenase n=1 Tax=Microbacterium aurantiacum TaxID=162393 RepID=A0AAJ2HMX4_9MICO|nr:iron-containing alcohol dehydrogenase [Microbacterium aurantiacum]MDS0247011.1 iron-containing alcohol dehydrogenase [Microbacterium aurantiacum]